MSLGPLVAEGAILAREEMDIVELISSQRQVLQCLALFNEGMGVGTGGSGPSMFSCRPQGQSPHTSICIYLGLLTPWPCSWERGHIF